MNPQFDVSSTNLLQLIPTGIFICDLQFQPLYYNSAFSNAYPQGCFPFSTAIDVKQAHLHQTKNGAWYRWIGNASDTCIVWSLQDVSEEIHALQQARYQDEKESIFWKQTGHMIAIYDIQKQTLRQHEIIAKRFGMSPITVDFPESYLQSNIVQAYHQVFRDFFEHMKQGIQHDEVRVEMLDAKQKVSWYEGCYDLIYDHAGEPIYGIITYEDISEQRGKELAYEKWQSQFEMRKNNSVAYYEYDVSNDCIESMHKDSILDHHQVEHFSELAQQASKEIIWLEDQEAYLHFFSRTTLMESFLDGKWEQSLEHRRLHSNKNEYYWAVASIQMILDPYSNTIKASVLIDDIHTKKTSLLELQQRSQFDALTATFNRGTGIAYINQILADYPHQPHSLLMIDLDNFKQINDTLGHLRGDDVLCDVATVLKEQIDSEHILCRLGGDEFIVFFKNTQQSIVFQHLLEATLVALCRTYEGITISASFGVSHYPYDGSTFQTLYERADELLYLAKNLGGNQICFS